ncbi:hypothetical protein HJFPF1_12680 [Paramyrothecium foliicola]|nr:hypothetical protein HJFPF1_12680 [Paramyrothecium foliicola]
MAAFMHTDMLVTFDGYNYPVTQWTIDVEAFVKLDDETASASDVIQQLSQLLAGAAENFVERTPELDHILERAEEQEATDGDLQALSLALVKRFTTELSELKQEEDKDILLYYCRIVAVMDAIQPSSDLEPELITAVTFTQAFLAGLEDEGLRYVAQYEGRHAPLDNDEWLVAQTAELVALREKTDHNALLERASNLNGRKSCHLNSQDPLGRSLMGGMHVHLEIVFEDGTMWLARILRETYTSFTDELSNTILLSECATLRWLEYVDVPTPHLYGYGLRGDKQNKVGVAYMLIEKLSGQPFDSYAASEEQCSHVMSQWAQILSRLAKHPFNKAGSLTFGVNGAIEVGPVASDRTGTLPCIGPFNTARELYSSWAMSYLNLIADGQLFSSFPVEAFLMFRYLLHQIKNGTWLDRWGELNKGPFFLKHSDDKGDHILVDTDFRITGVIDWTFAKVVPAYEAFGPSLVSANNADLFSGKSGLSAEYKILGQHLRRTEPSFCFFDSDEMRRLLFGLGMGLGLSKTEAITVFQAIIETFQGNTVDWELMRTTIDNTTWGANIRKEVKRLLALVNVDELIHVASFLRHGKACTFKPGQYLGPDALMGCANYHAWIQFDDGVRWLARIPRTTSFSDVPTDLVEYLVQSEYATLKWLERLGIPTPKAHAFGLASDPTNLVGVSYLLEDAMTGRAFDAYTATSEQKHHVYKQYAAILVKIRNHGLDQALRAIQHRAAVFTSVAEAHIELIADGQLYPEYPKEACLFYKLLRDEVAAVLSPVGAEAEKFYLKHVDDKGDHILVDADYNITGVID